MGDRKKLVPLNMSIDPAVKAKLDAISPMFDRRGVVEQGILYMVDQLPQVPMKGTEERQSGRQPVE